MDNQHQKISGYRDLSQADIDLMNDIKAHETATAALLHRVQSNCNASAPHAGKADAGRQVSIARTEFEAAFMRLVRAVAQPVTPWI